MRRSRMIDGIDVDDRRVDDDHRHPDRQRDETEPAAETDAHLLTVGTAAEARARAAERRSVHAGAGGAYAVGGRTRPARRARPARRRARPATRRPWQR